MKPYQLLLVLFLLTIPSLIIASENSSTPWGVSKSNNVEYAPQKVLYDLTSGNIKDITNILDRVSYLYKLYDSDPFDSSIIVIIHGDSIPFFTIDNFTKYKDLMIRAQSLTSGTPIEFRMCQAAAKVLGYSNKDIHGFVTMVPMADAEIVRLQQQEGYAFMQ